MMSASETALFSLSHYQLSTYERSKNRIKIMIASLLKHPRDLLVTILMVNVFSNILIQNTVSNLFESYSSWFIKVGIPLVLTLFLGEVVPKSLALPNNERVAYIFGPFLNLIKIVLVPIRKPLTKLTTWISRLLFFFLKREPRLNTAELEHILSTSSNEGVVSKDEYELIKGYLDLKEASVKEKMRPKSEIIFFNLHNDLNELVDIFVEKEISRLPVCLDEVDNIVGIISLKNYLQYEKSIHSGSDLRMYLQKPFFVPENTKAWQLLWQMRFKKEEFAVVVDEYGSVTGVISQEDLIESVVGEIEDKNDDKLHYHRENENVIIANGDMTLEEFEDVFAEKLESESSVVTLGGWLTDLRGDIPTPGEKFVHNDFLFYILDSDKKRVKRIYIRKRKVKKGMKK